MEKMHILSEDEISLLKSIVGRRLESYRLNDTDDTSFEIFVLRFSETDIEFAVNEPDEPDEVFGDISSVKIIARPERDSWSRVGSVEPENGIPEGCFMDYAVGMTITGVSVIVESLRIADNACEYVRGFVLNLLGCTLVFDKGPYCWEAIWRVGHQPLSASPLPSAKFDPTEDAGMISATRIERIAYAPCGHNGTMCG
ncbi:MAG: hypothetical protein ACI4QT_07445 [Kiritimatiellia bacterium]